MVKRIIGISLLVGGGLASVGCEPGDHEGTSSTVYDSSGIAIVEVSDGAMSHADSWSIPSQPSLSIGEAEGAPPYQLHRVVAALRLADGTIAVADNGSTSIRFFDGVGEFSHSVGRSGEGPGEYRVISLFGRYGRDSLVVWDQPLRRVTVLGIDGGLGRTFSAQGFEDSFVLFRTPVGDGSLLGRIDAGVRPEELPVGVLERETTYVRLRPSGRADTLGRFFSDEALVIAEPRGIRSLPFGRHGVSVAELDGFHFSSNQSYEVRKYAWDGELFRILRVRRETQPLTSTTVEMFIQEGLSETEDPADRQRREAFLENVPFPEDLPAFSQLKLDAAGNLWLAEYVLPTDASVRWTVLAPSGEVLAELTTPRVLEIHDIGSDYVLGVQEDELGVERVMLFPIVKQ